MRDPVTLCADLGFRVLDFGLWVSPAASKFDAC